MDPDAALDELLTLLDRTRTLTGVHVPPRVLAQDLNRILDLVDALDGWLSSGGCLPARWKPADRAAR